MVIISGNAFSFFDHLLTSSAFLSWQNTSNSTPNICSHLIRQFYLSLSGAC